MDIKDYWKDYHARNKQRINAKRRERYVRRAYKSMSKPIVVDDPIDPPKQLSAGKCLYCHNTETIETRINGVTYALCRRHRDRHP